MFAVGDDDVHGTGEAGELAGTGIGDDGDGELQGAMVHRAAVLEDECADVALESARDVFHGYVTGGTFDGRAGSEHFALAGSVEIAVVLLFEGLAAERVVVGFESGIERRDFDVEESGGVLSHGGFLLSGIGLRMGG